MADLCPGGTSPAAEVCGRPSVSTEKKNVILKSCFHVCSQATEHAWFIFRENNVSQICANCWQQYVSPSNADRETMFGDCSRAKLKMTLNNHEIYLQQCRS